MNTALMWPGEHISDLFFDHGTTGSKENCQYPARETFSNTLI